MMRDKNWKLKELPPDREIETNRGLKKLSSEHVVMAELKGIVSKTPSQNILINTRGLQEAKELQNYLAAMRKGFELITQN
jgi:hypothetical protein